MPLFVLRQRKDNGFTAPRDTSPEDTIPKDDRLVSRPLTRHDEEVVQAAIEREETPLCPRCGHPMALTEVPPRKEVSYVRHRVIAQCTRCSARAVVDRR